MFGTKKTFFDKIANMVNQDGSETPREIAIEDRGGNTKNQEDWMEEDEEAFYAAENAWDMKGIGDIANTNVVESNGHLVMLDYAGTRYPDALYQKKKVAAVLKAALSNRYTNLDKFLNGEEDYVD